MLMVHQFWAAVPQTCLQLLAATSTAVPAAVVWSIESYSESGGGGAMMAWLTTKQLVLCMRTIVKWSRGQVVAGGGGEEADSAHTSRCARNGCGVDGPRIRIGQTKSTTSDAGVAAAMPAWSLAGDIV